MAIRDSYAPGTPCWVDVTTPDTAASAAFYSGLFGWEARPDDRPEAGGYGMFVLDDQLVGGYGPAMVPDAPPTWNVYVSVADAEATMARVIAHGGAPLLEPEDVFDSGRVAMASDVTGTPIGLWQPVNLIGAHLVNDVGSFCWNELAVDDLAHARRFYAEVFSWGEQEPLDDGSAIFTVDGSVVCGAHRASPGEPNGWLVWFGVGDCDEAADRVTALGGRVISPPADMGFGRGAMVADAHGAAFGIASFGDPDET